MLRLNTDLKIQFFRLLNEDYLPIAFTLKKLHLNKKTLKKSWEIKLGKLYSVEKLFFLVE